MRAQWYPPQLWFAIETVGSIRTAYIAANIMLNLKALTTDFIRFSCLMVYVRTLAFCGNAFIMPVEFLYKKNESELTSQGKPVVSNLRNDRLA